MFTQSDKYGANYLTFPFLLRFSVRACRFLKGSFVNKIKLVMGLQKNYTGIPEFVTVI